ncbi:MAG: glutaminase, partial [Pigmentiphaga sp.]
MDIFEPPGSQQAYVSTGSLPPAERIASLVSHAHKRFATDTRGDVSQVYPALARVPPQLFGICVADTTGSTFAVGDSAHEFTIMSVSKPFVFGLICDLIGPTGARARIGAIATTSLAPGVDQRARWEFLRQGLSRFAGRELALNEEVYESASLTNSRNRSIAWMLKNLDRIYCDPIEAVDLYTLQCALDVSARDLAVMGATLADGGFNPVTREQVIKPETCHYVLAVMLTAGLYETSGDWLYEIGLPG